MIIYKNKFFTVAAILLMIGCAQRPEPVLDQSVPDTDEIKQEPHPEALKHFMDAQLYISQNNYPMAIIELQDALKLDPTAGSIHVSLSEAFWKLGKIERAEEHLNAALELNEKDVDARKMLAEQYIIRHQYDKANLQFKALRGIEPDEADHIIAQAELAAGRLQWDKAIQLYREAYDVDKAKIKALEKAAVLSLRSNKLQTAREIYAQLIKIDTRNVEYLSAYADLIIMEERFDEATEIINRIMEIEGHSKDRLFQSGIIFYQKQQLKQALDFFNKAYNIDDQDANVLHFIASVFLELDQLDSVAVYAKKQLELDPNDHRGYINNVLVNMNKNQFQNAVDILLPVAGKFTNEYAIQYLLGNAYYQQQQNEEALEYLNRALKISPKSRNILHILAIINDSMQLWTESDSLYESLISTDSTDAQAYNNYAYSLVERNEKLEFALQIATKAITLAPKNAAYLDTYGWILFKMGRINEALNYIQNSITLEDNNAIVLEHLGDVLMSANRKKDAMEYYRKAYEFDSNNDTLKNKVYPE
jgi:tetratricopeptide (TPR) repeat protein|tara:strand:+ start:8710 stop:10308 length:1599 start_codon:yes stop_codon:yes gene_type:complete